MQLITDLFFLPPDCLRIHKLGTGLCGASIRAVFLSQKMEVLLSVSAVFFAIKTAEDVDNYLIDIKELLLNQFQNGEIIIK